MLLALKQAVLQDALEPKMSKVSLQGCNASWMAHFAMCPFLTWPAYRTPWSSIGASTTVAM